MRGNFPSAPRWKTWGTCFFFGEMAVPYLQGVDTGPILVLG